jgi:hypothetical protein
MRFLLKILVVGSLLIFNGCEENIDSLDSYNFKGDGELIRLNFGGWKVMFEEFSLAEKYKASYSFVGLPENKALRRFS